MKGSTTVTVTSRDRDACIGAVFIVLLLALPFAGAAMSGLMTDIAGRIAAY